MPSHHIPQRSCVACGKIRPKRELVRLVMTGNCVGVDTSAKTTGRGAYLCPDAVCWDTGLKGKRLDNNLRTSISAENRRQLIDYAKKFKELSVGQD